MVDNSDVELLTFHSVYLYDAARDYVIPREAVEAAIAFYRRRWDIVEARVAATEA